MKEKNNNGKEMLKLLQEKYEINSAQELSNALKKMFKDMLQEIINRRVLKTQNQNILKEMLHKHQL